MCCPRITPAQPSTRSVLDSSSTWSATSGWVTRTPAPGTCSAASMNTSCRSSPAPRARRAASFTPRAASSNCWSKCGSHIRAVSTTLAVAHRACSCNRWSSSRRTPRATATPAPDSDPGAGRCRRVSNPTSRSTARSRTTRLGASPR